jgi:F420H(2)-dependent quinone reductase
MAYLNQPWFNREIINRFAMATGVVHSETLSVIKRASGQPQKTPVTPVEVDGVKYLVSTRGESQWVKNVRVDPNVTLTTKYGTTKYIATEIPVESRQPPPCDSRCRDAAESDRKRRATLTTSRRSK